MAGGRPCCDVTPDEAKRVWDSIAKAGLPVNAAMVARVFTASGRPVTQRAVHQWRVRGWKMGRSLADTNSAQVMREKLETGAAMVSGNAETRIADLVPEMDGAQVTYPLPLINRLEKYRNMSVEQLLTEASRAHLIAWSALMEEIGKNPRKYLEQTVEGVAKLMDVDGHNAAINMITGAVTIRERAMKIDDTMRDVSPRRKPDDEVPPQATDDPMMIELLAFRRAGTAGVAAVIKR